MLRAMPRPRLELLEMLETVQRAPQDQERPLLADQLDRRPGGGTTERLP